MNIYHSLRYCNNKDLNDEELVFILFVRIEPTSWKEYTLCVTYAVNYSSIRRKIFHSRFHGVERFNACV
jgi:hypothetical protein